MEDVREAPPIMLVTELQRERTVYLVRLWQAAANMLPHSEHELEEVHLVDGEWRRNHLTVT